MDATTRFNEAAGIHRRKRGTSTYWASCGLFSASMRPPEFTGGNENIIEKMDLLLLVRFNEAAGIHRRKRDGVDHAIGRVADWLQ